ncbi:MAG: DUF411 domain-containing protein [Rhodothermales bacterium]
MRTVYLTSLSLFVLLGGVLAACSPGSAQPSAESEQTQALPAVTVYKSPTCGCCSLWVDHLRENGFEAKTIDMPDVRPMKEQFGLPSDLGSCHTAVVDGYVIEGHVPAEDVKRLLAERPDVTGLAVPGMPIGSPGMEVEGRPADAYDVIAFTKGGERTVFASH